MNVALPLHCSFPFVLFGPIGLMVMLALWLLVNLAALHGLKCLVSWLWSALLTLDD
ncbi:hypothetical protein [Methylobacter sp. S3L5C]|uniref:hypothetical protein n=1 Tax=Methylobacter sp. S3L5C TaxID=2839024 RepID=UPI001FADF32C|nr:hypothetical protein [Methylobacter sp. S3L5C]UOA07806.1 hypothetical protein KKZ03_16335 [Methylobacter sp. S3L5C]